MMTTRKKLKMLQDAYEETRNDSSASAYVRDASMRSLQGLIDQLQEEIARYEAHQTVRQ
jgi:hypothetical protein